MAIEPVIPEDKETRDSYNETTTLNVTLQDQDLNQYVVKFRNPLEASEISRENIVNAFNHIIGGSNSVTGRPILFSRAKVPFTAVGSIQVVTVTTQKEDVQ